MTNGLLIIDIQRDYFPGGAYPLVGPEDAARAASTVLHAYRAADAPVIHIQHVWDAPDEQPREGVMFDEVMVMKPEAAHWIDGAGYVDYGRL